MTSLILLDPIQANIPKIIKISGHGKLTNNFSSQTKKYNKGSKKFSMPSPYSLEKFLKLESTVLLNSLRDSVFITGILFKNSIKILLSNPLKFNGFEIIYFIMMILFYQQHHLKPIYSRLQVEFSKIQLQLQNHLLDFLPSKQAYHS